MIESRRRWARDPGVIAVGDLTFGACTGVFVAVVGNTRSQSRIWVTGWPPRFVLLAVLWGLSFLLIKIGERSFAPLQLVPGRMIIGAVTLVTILCVGRGRLPGRWRTWGHLVVASVLLNVLPFSLLAYGERHVSSVLAGIWNAATPLFVLPVAILLISDEHATRQRITGLAVGFAGVLTVLGVWGGLGSTSLTGSTLCLGAAMSYGLGFPYARRYLANNPDQPIALAAGQLICGSLLLIVATVITAPTTGHISLGPVTAVIALGGLGTGIAYILNYSVIRDAGATVASTVTYLIPVFSTLAGITLLGEPVTWNQPAGAAIIALGATISQAVLRRPTTPLPPNNQPGEPATRPNRQAPVP